MISTSMNNDPWLRLSQIMPQAEYNLICLPFAGGFAEYFLPWRNHLGTRVQLCPIQLPGRSYRWQEPVITEIDSLLEAFIPQIEGLISEKPYVIFGHSMGGYIAYQLCKTLAKRQLPLPGLLVVSSVPAPQHWTSRKLLSELSEIEFSQFFLKLGGIQPELLKHESFIKMQMSLLRNDIALCESCKYTQPAQFTFPMLALGGSEDEYVSMPSMAAWAAETTADFAIHSLAGNHFYLNHHLPLIFELIKKRMTINVEL